MSATLRTHRVPSAALREIRTVRVLMPDEPAAVLFLADGQNVFTRPRTIGTRTKWRADTTARRAAPRLAIVAVDHAGPRRPRDYLPFADPLARWPGPFDADRHAAFVVEELRPWLARRYPAVADVRVAGIGGSSYGAVGALWTALRHTGAFDRLLIESAPLWVGDGRLLAAVRRAKELPGRVWIGVGTAEARSDEQRERLVGDATSLAVTLRERLGARRVRLRVDAGARHHESAWARRLPDALRFLFG